MKTVVDIISNTEELEDPIFVVGCARSGTGLLARTIGLSESVCYFGETRIIPRYYLRRLPISHAIQYYGRGGVELLAIMKGKARHFQDYVTRNDPLKEIITSMVRYSKLRRYDLKPPGMRMIDRYGINLAPEDVEIAHALYRKYTELGNHQVDRVLRIMFRDFQLIAGTSKVLEKTPIHARYIPILKRIFPKSKVCLILRDGRDVAASYLLNFGKRRADARTMRFICKTHKRIRLVDEKLSRASDSGCYRVLYEDLIAGPVPVMEGVFQFLELPFSDRVRNALGDVKSMPSNWIKLSVAKQKSVEKWLGLSSQA